ncbi:MAG: hypothetical protein ABIH42_03490 [Planctomycetota bacterium]
MGSALSINLFSGGLDSLLACKVLQAQDVKVRAVRFHSVFFPLPSGKSEEEVKKEAAEKYGIELLLEEVTEQFLDVVKSPAHGYGRWLNPCIDCKIFMYRKAAEVMKKEGADFISTGEVLNQRRMSQYGNTLKLIAAEAGLKGLVERPLSGKILSRTAAQEKGLIDREKLLDIIGRRRERQIAMAKQLGITDYPSPAGGCLLTDETFARRLKDLFIYNSADVKMLNLLGTGRHFRLSDSVRLLVGRNESENKLLSEFYSSHSVSKRIICMDPEVEMGPTALLVSEKEIMGKNDIDSAASIVARYSDGNGIIRVSIRSSDGEFTVKTPRADEKTIEEKRI